MLPVVKGNELELRTYKGADQLQTGSFHIQEPLGTAFPSPASIDLAIIPGVSFDRRGNRLGRGKGYYDRLLNKLNVYKIGICFQFQLTEPGLPTRRLRHTYGRSMDRKRERCLYRKTMLTITCEPT